jgi:hypothetical protein
MSDSAALLFLLVLFLAAFAGMLHALKRVLERGGRR